MENIENILTQQKKFFSTFETRSLEFRLSQLQKLKKIIIDNEENIISALKKDLNKPALEAILGEVALVIDEINYISKNLEKWMQPVKVSTPLPLMPGKSYLHFEPYGSVLILGPWNFPFLLIMSPLIGALCAGNCAVVKPSEHAPAIQDLIFELLSKNFDSNYIHVVKANSDETASLLNEKFDYIFFTGGTEIGRHVMLAAAKHLTPVTLELGGKSPCIIDKTADIDYTARRVVLSKMMNAGQICIAPDFLVVHEDIKIVFIDALKKTLENFYGKNPVESQSYGRIINAKHFQRIKTLIENKKVLIGGDCDPKNLYIAPTVLETSDWDEDVMQSEIFGPVLPLLTFTELNAVIKNIADRPKPLALYYFGKSTENENIILQNLSYGGGCFNDCITHILNVNLPFGGVGPSGMGGYHGKYSFSTFSHTKSIYKKTILTDFGYPYPPYSVTKLKWVRKFLGFWLR